jgi:hypothetical protein
METIFWISVGLFVIAMIMVGYTVRKHNKMFGDEDPVPSDDGPGHYEDVEYSERPFIEYFN